jgi:uncharacterized protein YwqG
MKYFTPKLESATKFDFQTNFSEKLGGFPFGLPIEMYPICKECRNPMIFLAQFLHHKDRLDLGKEGRILFVFVCDYEGEGENYYNPCESWDADSGANVCFVIEPETFTGKTLATSDLKIPTVKETFIGGWAEFNDEITEDESKFFFDTEKYDELDFSQFVELLDKTTENTRLGGVPYWIQYPETPKGSWKFIGQLNSDNGLEFGDVGIGYIFIDVSENSEQLPKGKFLWQCS